MKSHACWVLALRSDVALFFVYPHILFWLACICNWTCPLIILQLLVWMCSLLVSRYSQVPVFLNMCLCTVTCPGEWNLLIVTCVGSWHAAMCSIWAGNISNLMVTSIVPFLVHFFFVFGGLVKCESCFEAASCVVQVCCCRLCPLFLEYTVLSLVFHKLDGCLHMLLVEHKCQQFVLTGPLDVLSLSVLN
jgi:hypothetical protein